MSNKLAKEAENINNLDDLISPSSIKYEEMENLEALQVEIKKERKDFPQVNLMADEVVNASLIKTEPKWDDHSEIEHLLENAVITEWDTPEPILIVRLEPIGIFDQSKNFSSVQLETSVKNESSEIVNEIGKTPEVVYNEWEIKPEEVEHKVDIVKNEIWNELNELQDMRIKMLSMKKEMELLKSKSEDLINKNRALDSKLSQYQAALSSHFTQGQIKRMLNPNKKFSSWDSKDIASAISLRSVSPKAYRYLRKNGYPVPALSTLRRWASRLQLTPKILTEVVKLIK